jgi:hypothetical protein
MYMYVVHGGHILVHNALGGYIIHDSRRRYLSEAYLEKRPIFEEIAQRHNSRGSDGHRGSMFDVFSALHQSDIPCSKGERLFKEDQRHSDRGRSPKESSSKGSSPKRRMALFH